METSHPSTRAVNLGSGNRALVKRPPVVNLLTQVHLENGVYVDVNGECCMMVVNVTTCCCCSMSVYETNSSDDETNKVLVSPAPMPDSEENRSTLSESSVSAKDPAVDSAAPAAVTSNSHATINESSEPEDDGEVNVPPFKYMNAADVAEALQTGSGVVGGASRVKSIDSEDEETDPVHSGGNLAPSPDSQNNPSSSSPNSDEALPVPEALQDSTPDVVPSAAEIVDNSTSDVAQNQDERTENEKKSEDVQRTSGESPKSSPLPQSDVVAGDVSAQVEPDRAADEKSQPDVIAAGKATADEANGDKTTSRRHVTLRRGSRAVPLSAAEPPKTPVVELHIDTDFKPTVFSDFELDHISSDTGSAVQKLKRFLENDKSATREVLPTAIQPGKAFDSLKYFISTLN